MSYATEQTPETVSIIGLSLRAPGADDVATFWKNLCYGVESVRPLSSEELLAAGVDPAMRSVPGFVAVGAPLNNVERFDAHFFGLNPRDAELMDPQHRIFLECAYESLENAGYAPDSFPGLIGVFGGMSLSSYVFYIHGDPSRMRTLTPMQIGMGTDKDYLTTQVSYRLNLRGPSVSVQSACSTSLVAVSLAAQSLLNFQCDLALAGGAGINVPQKQGYFFQPGGIMSPDGHCRAFDVAAQGTMAGNGVGLVVLKRTSEAIADGDEIWATIRGYAMNNDGSMKVGYTAPSVQGQAQVIAMAQAMAGISPEDVGYIETHGTATRLGDPIEVAALTEAFRQHTAETGFCGIGSLKTNIGHLDAAAGIASLIKAALSVRHGYMVPSLHFKEPNPELNLPSTPFYIVDQLTSWETDGRPRIAGVSSFGIGGTNAHVIVEEPPKRGASGPARPASLLVLSAKTATALESATDRLAQALLEPDLNIADAAWTLQTGRNSFSFRRAAVCRTYEPEEASQLLASRDPSRVITATWDGVERRAAFLFSGQGSQYAGMGAQLYRHEPVFRACVDQCRELLTPLLSFDPGTVLLEARGNEEAAEVLKHTSVTQPALFTIEYALARLWMSWGIEPVAMLGHSIGEYVAACLAGVFSLEDALMLVATRGYLMGQIEPGAMLSVPLSETDLRPLLEEDLDIASLNAPGLCAVSGSFAAIERLETELSKRRVFCRRLQTSHAFHSNMMNPAIEPLMEAAAKVQMRPPQIPFVSNVTGTWAAAHEVTTPAYWGMQMRNAVRFSDAIRLLLDEPSLALVEVGPGRTLCSLARQHPQAASRTIVPSLPAPQEETQDVPVMLEALGRLWVNGVKPDWSGLHAHQDRHRIPLPTYPFERQHYWIGPSEELGDSGITARRDLTDWFYTPSWTPSELPETVPDHDVALAGVRWLIFADTAGIAQELAERVRTSASQVTLVSPGSGFSDSGDIWTIRPSEPSDYDRLLRTLADESGVPHVIVHCWNVADAQEGAAHSDVDSELDRSFYSLLSLAQAIGNHELTEPVGILAVTTGIHAITGQERLQPVHATVLGPCTVIPQEYPGVMARSIDIEPGIGEAWRAEQATRILTEIASSAQEPIVSWRDGARLTRTFEPIPQPPAVQTPMLRPHGVYLITGGYTGIGLVLAEHLAVTLQARLVLVGRSGLPPRGEWEQWLREHEDTDLISHAIRKIRVMEEAGSEVLLASGDVGDYARMAGVVHDTLERFGEINGLIHSAGVAGGGVIQLKQHEVAQKVLHPKVHGAMVLDSVLSGVPLDFFAICSSLASIVGGFGQVDYCAANAFLDAFARARRSGSSAVRIGINWDAWQEVGMAVHTELPPDLEAERQEHLRAAIKPSEGGDCFIRLLHSGLSNVLVSTTDLLARLSPTFGADEAAPELSDSEAAAEAVPGKRHPRPPLACEMVPPRNEIERKVTAMWEEVLGTGPIGVNDNFFELGGHSLLAIRLLADLRDVLGGEITIQNLFSAPTVSQLVQNFDRNAEREFETLLAEVESLSDEEAARLLEDTGGGEAGRATA